MRFVFTKLFYALLAIGFVPLSLSWGRPILGWVALSSLQPLRRRNFALIWSAALVSNVGSWMQTVAVGALVTEATGKSAWTGIVAAAAFIPIGIFAPVGGALADRVDRRRYFIGTTIGETFFAALLALAVATGNGGQHMETPLAFCVEKPKVNTVAVERLFKAASGQTAVMLAGRSRQSAGSSSSSRRRSPQ